MKKNIRAFILLFSAHYITLHCAMHDDFKMYNELDKKEQEFNINFMATTVGILAFVGISTAMIHLDHQDKQARFLFKNDLVEKKEELKLAVFKNSFDVIMAENLMSIRGVSAVGALGCCGAFIKSLEFDKNYKMEPAGLLLITGAFIIVSGTAHLYHAQQFRYAKDLVEQLPSQNSIKKKQSVFTIKNCNTPHQFKIKH